MPDEEPTTRARTGDCKERVAYDLMRLIAKFDLNAAEEVKRDAKAYWLGLYAECRNAVEGRGPAKKKR